MLFCFPSLFICCFNMVNPLLSRYEAGLGKVRGREARLLLILLVYAISVRFFEGTLSTTIRGDGGKPSVLCS